MKSMLRSLSFLALSCAIISCDHLKEAKSAAADQPVTTHTALNGTWQLLSSQVITKGDTVNSFPVKNQEMIKVFTDNQFAFFKHDINKGVGENATYDSGSGSYTLAGTKYDEHLAYCTARGWEDKDFTFTLEIRNDSLIQKGIEKIDSLNVNHEIVEIYKRLR